MITIRGATKLKEDTIEEVKNKSIELFDAILKNNKIAKIESVIFSVTPDIRSLNPSTAVRTHYNYQDVSFMTLQEAIFENSENLIIRVLVFCESSTKNYIYLHSTKNLRKNNFLK
jgi:chorismate mutase